MPIDFRARGREEEREGRERNIHVREKHQWVASSVCLNQGLNPQLSHVP